MGETLYADLAWLLPAPDDFGGQVRALKAGGAAVGAEARRLASHALDAEQLRKLSAALDGLEAQGVGLAPLQPFRLGLLSNATTDLLAPCLRASAARHGIDLALHVADYGQVAQEAMDPGSDLYAFAPDAVLVAVDHRGLPFELRPGRPEEARAVVEGVLRVLRGVRDGVHAHSRALCILQTLARPPETLFGSLDYALAGTARTLIEAVNRGLADSLASRDLLLDVAGMAETVGLANWHDPALWNLGKIPFDLRYVPLYADHLARLIAAALGRSRKVLALDLDNTVWGGIIGDDGLEGINIAQGDAVGEAHLELQRTALDLRSRGVVLAVSSKNDNDKARQPFREHAEMRLREDHIAAFRANWDDKASNLEAIARQLELGADSIAFIDDNPMERDLVRRLAPAVSVPELPEEPALYARTLLAAGYFEAVAMTEEDRARADLYQTASARAELQSSANNLDDYLASLGMVIVFRPFDAVGRARIAQLINKSNQFNLTTRRSTEAEVAALEEDAGAYTLQVRLTDTFGDNGMICVVVARKGADAWDIDTWLMSCRVLKRRVEESVLAHLAAAARAEGAHQIVGRYIPSPKNGIVAEHYDRLGFRRVAEGAGGERTYALDLESYAAPNLAMTVDVGTPVPA